MFKKILTTGPSEQYSLGGGSKHFVFLPLPGEILHVHQYFSDGLVQPPTRRGLFLEPG